ncbi:MAG TPA: hypothetical protein DD640_07260 [Clostridiales bacterium]|nr:hypothetical protein [Clostridiales bacterium]
MILVSLLIVYILFIWLQGWIYRRYWSQNLDVKLRFSTPTGVEGGTIRLTEQITSRKILPLPWLTVKFQVSRFLVFPDNLHATISDDYYREDLFSLGIYQRINRNLTVLLNKRGYYTIKSIDLVSSDLLLTSKLVSHMTSQSVLTVCPRLISREDLLIPYRQLIGQVLTRQSLLPDPFEFRTIREYQGFDNLRSINWMATARTGQLKVNVHEATASREIRILLNVEPDGTFYDELLIEDEIRIAASICTYAAEDGVSCSLCSNAPDILTGERVDVAAGQSIQHIQQIQEQLGRLDLSRPAVSFTGILDQVPQPRMNEPVLLLISLNCSSELCRKWDSCLDLGYKGTWIVPRFPAWQTRIPETENPVFFWEVRPNGS